MASYSKNKIDLAALTSVLNEDLGFANLKKKVLALEASDESLNKDPKHESEGKGSGKTIEILSAPLPSHEQKRLEREAAYELATRELGKWIPVIRANRQSKSLVFPAEKSDPLYKLENAMPDTLDPPRNDLEAALVDYWREHGAPSDEGITAFEDMEATKVSIEDLENQHEALAKKRARLFFNEKKLRQQAKIKSKTYRRLLKREREREEQRRRDEEDSLIQATAEELAERQMQAEMDRIRERMTLKTRKANQWAHQLLQKRRLESESREQVLQQVRDKQRLREEIMGKPRDFEEPSSSSSGEEDATIEFVPSDHSDGENVVEKYNTHKTHGRPRSKSSKPRDDYVEGGNEYDDDDGDERPNEIDDIFSNTIEGLSTSTIPGEEMTIGRRKFNPPNPINTVEDTLPTSFQTKKRKTLASSNKNNEEKGDGFTLENNFSALFALEEDAETKVSDKNALGIAEDEVDKPVLEDHAKKQLDIIKRAFAGDQVFEEFEAMKAAEVAQEGPQEIDMTLPGWGSWGGHGITPAKGKVVLKKKGIIDPRNRQDAHLNHVIIHERRSKKSLKLMVDRPPRQFENREEYEEQLSIPIGREWNSATAFKQKTTPRIQVKVGSIIEPIKFIKKSAAHNN